MRRPKTYKEAKEKGLCWDCGKPVFMDKTRCRDCLAKCAEHSARRRKGESLIRLCGWCEEPFEVSAEHKEYCSKECRYKRDKSYLRIKRAEQGGPR